MPAVDEMPLTICEPFVVPLPPAPVVTVKGVTVPIAGCDSSNCDAESIAVMVVPLGISRPLTVSPTLKYVAPAAPVMVVEPLVGAPVPVALLTLLVMWS
jgi:hypothetical protein